MSACQLGGFQCWPPNSLGLRGICEISSASFPKKGCKATVYSSHPKAAGRRVEHFDPVLHTLSHTGRNGYDDHQLVHDCKK